METSPRHCEELLRRSNPVLASWLLDCFASLAMTGRGQWKLHPRHCEELLRRSNPGLASWLLDCFASLAMTGRGQWKLHPVIARSSCDEAIQALLPGSWIASLRSQ